MADTLPLPMEHTYKVEAAVWGQPIAAITCPTCNTPLEAGTPVCHVCGHTFPAAHVVKAQEQVQKQESGRAIGIILTIVFFVILCALMSQR